MERLLGGAQKHTFLVRCKNGFSFVAYKWDSKTSYFEQDKNALFCSSSAELFESNNHLMKDNGVITPELYFMDRTKTEQNYDYAFVEYIDGHDMDYITANQKERLPAVLDSLNSSSEKLHGSKSETAGQAGKMLPADFKMENYILDGMIKNKNFLQEHDAEYKQYYESAFEKAKEYALNFSKRNFYTFIHAELGPNHGMVNKNNEAYLIDIEGAKFSDVEEELSFLDMRFEKRIYNPPVDMDLNRMSFYHIMHCLSNLRGAVELKEKNYYDMDDINQMLNFFHEEFKRGF